MANIKKRLYDVLLMETGENGLHGENALSTGKLENERAIIQFRAGEEKDVLWTDQTIQNMVSSKTSS